MSGQKGQKVLIRTMMAMVEESAIEMGSTAGSVGGGALNQPGSVIVADNMPELVAETEEER